MNLRPSGYAYQLQLSLRLLRIEEDLWSGLSLHPFFPKKKEDVHHKVSTPFPIVIGTWLGITTLQASPNLMKVIPEFLPKQP